MSQSPYKVTGPGRPTVYRATLRGALGWCEAGSTVWKRAIRDSAIFPSGIEFWDPTVNVSKSGEWSALAPRSIPAHKIPTVIAELRHIHVAIAEAQA